MRDMRKTGKKNSSNNSADEIVNMKAQTKNRWYSWLIYIVIFLLIMLAANMWKTRNITSGNLSELGGVLMDGSEFTISEFSGKPVLIYFWATWCPICNMVNGSVQSISEDYPVISVASWSQGEVKAYMHENQLTFPVLLDNTGEMAQTFGLKGVPISFILNPNGEIKFVESGYSTETGLRLWLSTL